jgi:hypothetical protein
MNINTEELLRETGMVMESRMETHQPIESTKMINIHSNIGFWISFVILSLGEHGRR